MAKLNTYVHVVELDSEGRQTGRAAVFGPDDDLPAWAVKAITNPDVWDGDAPSGGGGAADKPPARNEPKSAWVEYAVAQGAARDEAEASTKDELVERYTA